MFGKQSADTPTTKYGLKVKSQRRNSEMTNANK